MHRRHLRPALLLCLVSGAAWLAAAGGSGAALGAGSTAARAASNCSQFNVTGKRVSVQSNIYRITWLLKQKGAAIMGTATLTADQASQAGYTGTVGTVTGTMKGARLAIVVKWPHRADGTVVKGEYVGTVKYRARARVPARSRMGRRDLANPSAKGTWVGTGVATCGSAGSETGR